MATFKYYIWVRRNETVTERLGCENYERAVRIAMDIVHDVDAPDEAFVIHRSPARVVAKFFREDWT